jgi:CYTH domain-containing protein/CHAD domain-containing protein
MSSEIERKFLLGGLPSRLADRDGEQISQGYLTNGEEAEIRLRRAGPQTLLTVKTGAGEVREEVEVELREDLFDSLWPLTEGRRVVKTRLREPLGDGLDAEVDVYGDRLKGLVVAEVEFDSPERSREFSPPAWFGKEITGDARYANRALAGSGAPRSVENGNDGHSRSFRLKRKEGVGDGIRRIACGRVEKALEALEEEAADDPATAIHSARKDLKKIRSVLRLARSELGDKLYRAEDKRYRNAGRALSGSRDTAVKVETLDALEERFGKETPSASAGAWRRLLEQERDDDAKAARSTGGETLAAPIAALGEGCKAVAEWPLASDSWKLVGPGLERSYRRGRKAMARATDDADPELVHEWRKRAKDLWYQLRLIRRAWPGLLEETVDRAHELADLLGDHHDLTVLAVDLAGRPEVGSRPLLAELIERRQAELLDRALALGARLYAEKPKAFGKRMRAYWLAWR